MSLRDLLKRVSKGIYRDTGRSVERSDATRRDSVGNPEQQLEALDEGLIPVTSSWVLGMKFIPTYGDRGVLVVRFRKGAVVAYSDIGEDLFDDFFASESKGRFVHKYLADKPYRLIRAGE